MRWTEIDGLECSVARTLAVIGDRWTLLILRELLLGSRRFDRFQTYLRVSPPTLADRLAKLEAAGIVDRHRYLERPARFEYRLTEKGASLNTVMTALADWGDRWRLPPGGEAPVVRHHLGCGGRVEARLVCAACAREIEPARIERSMSHALVAERAGLELARAAR